MVPRKTFYAKKKNLSHLKNPVQKPIRFLFNANTLKVWFSFLLCALLPQAPTVSV